MVVDEVDGRANAEGRLGGGWKAADIEVMTAYLADPAPTTVVALVARDLKPDSALGKAAQREGSVLEYGFAPKKLVPWVAERFRQHGVSADGDACQALVDLVGDDPYGLATEIDKLATWAAGDTIASRDVAALVAATADPPIFELTDAWARRDAAGALEVSEAIFGHEAKSRRDIAPRLAAGVTSHVTKVKTAKRLAELRRGAEGCARRAGDEEPVLRREAVLAGRGVLRSRSCATRRCDSPRSISG